MIRLQRVGRKHEPVFRLILTDSKNSAKTGKFLEILGNFDARRKEQSEFEAEKIKHWISKGVKLSDTVHNLLIDKKIITGKKINKLPKKSPIKDEISQKVETANSVPAQKVKKETTETVETAEIEIAPETESAKGAE